MYRAKRDDHTVPASSFRERGGMSCICTIVLIEYSSERNFFFIILSCPAIRILKVHMGRINYLQNARVNPGRERWYPPPLHFDFFLFMFFFLIFITLRRRLYI